MSIDWTNIKALLLEDEPVVALSTEMDLQDLGVGLIEVCYRLRTAEEVVREKTFDIAILDINVQGQTTSIEFGRALAKTGTKVVFASGNNFADTGLGDGEFIFVPKPYSFQALKEALQDALENA